MLSKRLFPACYTDYPKQNSLFYKHLMQLESYSLLGIIIYQKSVLKLAMMKVFDVDDDLF